MKFKIGDYLQGKDKSYIRSIYQIIDIEYIEATPIKYKLKCLIYDNKIINDSFLNDIIFVDDEYEKIEPPKHFKILFGDK